MGIEDGEEEAPWAGGVGSWVRAYSPEFMFRCLNERLGYRLCKTHEVLRRRNGVRNKILDPDGSALRHLSLLKTRQSWASRTQNAGISAACLAS